jgi:drug/metabolite transporter (DMT)-like permease
MNLVASPLVNVLLFSIFWALEIFITKFAFVSGAQIIPFTIQSSFLTLLILSVYVTMRRLKELKAVPFKTILWILLANAIHMGIGGFLSNAGIQYTTAINAGFLTQFLVVTGTLLAWVILKEKLTLAKILSVCMIMVGTFFLTTNGKFIVPHIGDLLIIGACFAWAVGGILVRKILKDSPVNADIISFFRPIAGIPILLLFMLFSPLYPAPLQTIFHVNIFTIYQPLYVTLNAIFVSLVWIFVNRTLKVASASYTAILPSITPIIIAVLAIIFLHESITVIQSVGIILILASSIVAHYLQFDKH